MTEEEKFLKVAYLCQKCQSLHMSDDNLDGTVCFPHPGKYNCDGILKKVTSVDEYFEVIK